MQNKSTLAPTITLNDPNHLTNQLQDSVQTDGFVIAADSRRTAGNIIFNNNVLKIHRLSDYIYVLGVGTSADCDF
ncbi:hypothetical protein I4U23_026971 [Adineta vaga]|nr:hypothetical protein I4U23_026971 [Adineta vaga]